MKGYKNGVQEKTDNSVFIFSSQELSHQYMVEGGKC